MDIDIAGPIIDAIVKKQSVILKLDEQILENTSDEDIEVEITDADEYNLDLETNLRRYKKLAQTVTRTCTELSHESIPNTRPVMNMHEVNSETRPVMNTEFFPRYSSQTTNNLKDTKSVELTRLLNNDGLSPQTARIHIFTDASKQAYGACAYIVQGKQSQLVMAKNRVAPLKVITLPRLELMGAVVGAKLAKHVSNILGITEITFWCDSQIVLSWLYSSKIQKPFIANRITEIRQLVENKTWRYCPTDCNPADYLTRGMSSSKFLNNDTWFNGPKWLAHEEQWPHWDRNSVAMTTITDNESKDIVRQIQQNDDRFTVVKEVINIEKFSSFPKLLRIMSYVLRFIANCRTLSQNRKYQHLEVDEIQNASLVLIRNVQKTIFMNEIRNIVSKDTNRLPIVLYKKRMSREMKETHILLRQFFGDKLCPSGQYPLLGNICLEDNNSDEIDLDESFLRSSRLPHDHLPTFGHSQGQT
ncbi:unnamed protein product [Mytilus edulis]|uniref:Uncharacterized protein n=1 Tax=Mytilus edulis TaxID=6550 RepID=A0A8S3PN13_MYTED|nr:unnamed protein product [Mytilus edulis]